MQEIGSRHYPYSFHLAFDKYNMDINLDNIALELYGKLQTRFPDVKIGSEIAEVLSKKEDIPNARFFEFPYKEQGRVLGTITITLDEDDGVILQVGGDLVDSDVPGVFNFIRSMGRFANKRLLNFKIVNLEKSSLDKRDYEFQAKSKELPVMPPVNPVMESKFYGTTKISYQDLGEARIVIKHNAPINTELAAGRTMHIESIYVENADGERFKYPYKHLNGARALAEHLKHGGNPYDAIGKHITGLSEELSQLRKFKGYVGRNEALAEAMGDINSRVMERIEQVKKEVQSLQRKSYYETFAESFEERESQSIPEAVMDDWIDRLTIRTFNEDLKTAFPYIFKLIGESDIPVKELNPEDVLSELSKDTLKSYKDKAMVTPPSKKGNWVNRVSGVARAAEKLKKSEMDDEEEPDDYPSRRHYYDAIPHPHDMGKDYVGFEESYIESFLDSIVEDGEGQDGINTLFSPNKEIQQAAIAKLNKLLASDLKSGDNEINAKLSLKGIIDDPEFIQSLDNVDPDLDIRVLIQQYVQERAPQVAMQLEFGEEQTGGEEPVAAPAPAPAPAAEPAPPEAVAAPEAGAVPPEQLPQPAPVAESMGNTKLRAKFIKAKECGANLDTEMDFGSKTMTLLDAIKQCGLTPMECGFEDPEAEVGESGVDQILKMISGFWNKEEKNFTIGGTRAKQKVVKAFKDGEFPNATEEDVKQVLQKIEQMDPSSSEQSDVMKLAGIAEPQLDDHRPAVMIAKIGTMSPMESVSFKQEDSLARIIQLSR